MADDLDTLRLKLLGNLDQQFTPFYQEISDYILGVLTKAEDPDGTIPPYKLKDIISQVNTYVNNKFLGVKGTPYTVSNQGQIIPNSEYFQTLWDGIRLATKLGVSENYLMMVEVLQDDPALKQKLSIGTLNPLTAQQLPDDFSHLGNFDPSHEWIDPAGKKLSDRIWAATGDTRLKLDQYLTEAIQGGKTARELSKDVETFLLPGEALKRTNRPYGTDASFSGMRLARTEIASAQVRAHWASSQLNPFVDTYDIVLSHQHPEPDICDEMAAGGPYDKDDYLSLPPGSTHPMCICRTRFNRSQNIDAIKRNLRDNLDNNSSEIPITPLRLEAFVNMLIGTGD